MFSVLCSLWMCLCGYIHTCFLYCLCVGVFVWAFSFMLFVLFYVLVCLCRYFHHLMCVHVGDSLLIMWAFSVMLFVLFYVLVCLCRYFHHQMSVHVGDSLLIDVPKEKIKDFSLLVPVIIIIFIIAILAFTNDCRLSLVKGQCTYV